MLPDVIRATLIALVASAVSVSGAPNLYVKVSGEPAVTGVDKLVVKTTVTNTGNEILTLLNHPQSPLNKLPADTFAISDATGTTPDFTGVKVKYVLSTAIATGKDAVTVIAPGQSVEVEHNLSEAYAFSKEGKYEVVSNSLFYVVDDQKQAVPVYATVEGHTTKLTGRLAVPRPSKPIKRATYNGCTSYQQSSLLTAAGNGNIYASNASAYLQAHTSGTPRFTTWFGTYTSSHHSTVLNHYSSISGHDMTSYTFDCTCTDSGTYAYVYPDQFGTVYLCGAFWNAPATGTDSQAGTLVHESSHFTINGGTQDYVYGQSAAQSLANSNPAEAIMNADNHEYFAENNPARS